jgi:acyl dehydratase
MSALRDLLDVELGPTSWIEVTQERIDAFASATDDPQWIHVDRERAAAGPYGTTIAHGYLTLSLTVPMLDEGTARRGRDVPELRGEPGALPRSRPVRLAHPRAFFASPR